MDVESGISKDNQNTHPAPQNDGDPQLKGPSTVSAVSRNSQEGKPSRYESNENVGVVAFEPVQGTIYETLRSREDYLQTVEQSSPRTELPEPRRTEVHPEAISDRIKKLETMLWHNIHIH